MRKHLAIDPENLRLVIVVNSGMIGETILQVVFNTYRMLDTSSKFRCVRTLNQSRQEIEQYELTHTYHQT